MHDCQRTGRALGWLKWLGRLIGLAASALFLAFFIGEGVPEITESGIPAELRLFIPLLLAAIAGCVVALFRAGAGGVMQIIGGGAMGIYHLVAGGLNDLDVAVVFGVPYILAGAIAIVSSRNRAAAATDVTP